MSGAESPVRRAQPGRRPADDVTSIGSEGPRRPAHPALHGPHGFAWLHGLPRLHGFVWLHGLAWLHSLRCLYPPRNHSFSGAYGHLNDEAGRLWTLQR